MTRSIAARHPQGKRLCMVVHGPYPVGEPRVAREVGAALRAGFAVDVIATLRPGEPEREGDGRTRIFRIPIVRKRGVSALLMAVEYASFATKATRLVARLDRERPYQVVQVHTPPDFLLVAGVLPRLRGARVLLDVHDLAPDMFEMRFGRHRLWRIGDKILRMIERTALYLADEVVTVHEPYRRELTQRGGRADRTTVVMNAVDEELLPQVNRRNSSSDQFRIVYHGTITPPYGVEVLVTAMAQVIKQVPNARLELLGEGDAIPGVRATIAAHGLQHAVSLSDGYLPHAAVLERIATAAVGVIPNLRTQLNRYALSSKLFEYVALGVPVVCARLPTLEEHFGDHELRFFAPGDPQSLAEAIVSVAFDIEGAKTRADAALRRYVEYRWKVNSQRYISVLERLSSNGTRMVHRRGSR